MKKNNIIAGDKITTKKTAECGEGKNGTIIGQHRDNQDFYGVMFDFKHPKFHKLQSELKDNGILNENKGLWLQNKDFILKTTTDTDRRMFNNLMTLGFVKTINTIPTEITRSKSVISSNKAQIKERVEYNLSSVKEIERHEKIITKLKATKRPEIEDYNQLYSKLLKHPDINNVFIKEGYIIVKTNDLTYTHKDDTVTPFNLGAYYIFIPPEVGEIKAINYKKQMDRGNYFHPCIKVEGRICMGGKVGVAIDKYHKENQIGFLIYLLIDFFKKPDYTSPYKQADLFRCAQPVTYKPKDIIDYLDCGKWDKKEKWNNKEYILKKIEEYKKDITRFKKEKINLNQIERLENRIENNQREYDNINH